jgi:nucleotide-binding universal stress UspA family protein
MCTRGRSGLSRLVIGSVAEKVVRHAPVPVLSFHPKGTRTRARARAA